MDNYPAQLAPEFEESGAIKTPFAEWWVRVKDHFPTVPEEVARYWLHEHWSHSPYKYLESRAYQFELVTWKAEYLSSVLSCWSNFDPTNAACYTSGEGLEALGRNRFPYKTAVYMIAHGDFPSPIIVLDNRDGHLGAEKVDRPWKALPTAYVLIEGHRRFNLALHLHRTNQLNKTVKIWMMTCTPDHKPDNPS